MYFAGFGYIQHFLVLISKSTVIIAEYCFSSSISAADYTYGEKAACYVQNKFNCWIYTTYLLVYVNKGAAPMNLREMLAISRGNWMADTIFYCIYPNARSAAGRMENHLTFFYIFAIFSLFRSCRFYVLAALAYLYVLDDSAEAVLFYRKLCFHADRQKSVKI